MKRCLTPFWLLVLVLAGLLALVHGTASSSWLLQQVPGLTVQGFRGALAGDWQVEHLLYEDAGRRLELRNLQVQWRPACLWRARLCVEVLQADSLSWHDSQPAESQSQPVPLPVLNLPLVIEVDRLAIGELYVQGSRLFSEFGLSARFDRQGLQIESLSLAHGALKLAAKGHLQPEGSWPLSVQLDVQLPDQQQREWRLHGQLSGQLQERLQLQLDSKGYLDGQLTGSVQPLQPNVPLQLELRSEAFNVHPDLPATLQLEQLQMNLAGDLEQGFDVQALARLPAQQSPVQARLQGRLSVTGADLEFLRLQAADPTQQVQLQGRLDWAETLKASGRLQWRALPWERLWPGIDVPVTLQQLQADLTYSDAGYSADWQAQLQGPPGAFSLSSKTHGTAQQVFFEQLQMQAGEGRAEGRLQLDLTEGVRWSTELQFQALNPGYWLADLPGQLQGPLRGSGSFVNGQLATELELDLQGRLREQPAALIALVQGTGQTWQVPRLNLRLGDNRITGQLTTSLQLAGQLEVTLHNMAQLWPGLAGRADGSLTLAGTLDEPQGELQLQGKRLQLDDLRVQQLDLQASLAAALRGRLQLKASGLARDDLQLGELQLNASGTPNAHQINLHMHGEPLQLALQARAGMNGQDWKGQLSQGRFAFAGQSWQLQAPMPISYSTHALRIGAHCWVEAPASLCSSGLQLLPQAQIAYRLREFPMQRLQAFWPEDFAWDAQAQADIDLQLNDDGPNGRVDLQVAAGNLRVREEDEWLLLPYDRLSLNSRLLPQSIDTRVQFKAPELGQVELQVQLDPARPNWPMRGRYQVRDVDVGALRPFFSQLTELAGTLQGQGELGGHLLAPVASGNLQLLDGRVAGDGLPLTMENLRLDMRLSGQQMSIQGGWQSGGQGSANLQGQLDWSQALQLDVQLSGSRLPLFFEPNIQLQAEPDLQLQLRDQRLSVSGRVEIPSGQITLREIPPQAVRRSPDARIVNAGRQVAAPIQLAMDVELVVGSERLTFRGLGLIAELQGRLRVTDNLTSRGELQLRNGRFHAFGQRLTIRRARLLFVGPLDQPHLDIEAVRRVGVITAGIRITGRSDRPVTDVFSEPLMSEDQALSYLVLGRPMGGGDNSALTQAAIAIGMASSAPLTERLGVRELEVDSEGIGGRMFSDRLTVRYGIDAMQPDRVLVLRYELTRRLYMEAASGLSSSLDLVYRRDF